MYYYDDGDDVKRVIVGGGVNMKERKPAAE